MHPETHSDTAVIVLGGARKSVAAKDSSREYSNITTHWQTIILHIVPIVTDSVYW